MIFRIQCQCQGSEEPSNFIARFIRAHKGSK